MPRKYTDITVILDRSSSMHSIKAATIEGLNGFIEDQKAVPGDGCWTIVQFDDPGTALGAKEEFPQVLRNAVPQDQIKKIEPAEFRPRGSTALIDAVCKTIDATGRRLEAMKEADRPDKVLFVIVTDGEENSSTMYTKAKLNEKISHQRSMYNWQFIFLGANQDAIAEARSYGIPASSALNYAATAAGTAGVYRSSSVGTRAWKAEDNPSAAPLLSSAEPDDPNIKVNVNVTVPGAQP